MKKLLFFTLLAFICPSMAFAQSSIDKPDEIPLGKSIRQDRFNSPLGSIDLRWSREVEKLFGRDPLRATIEASRAVSRVLRLSSIPSHLQNISIDWNIAFMEQIPANARLPRRLFEHCHPGWMIPPANIYIVGERISSGCGSKSKSRPSSVADEKLSKVVVHELAHAIEYQILGASQWRDRARAEGFAAWFEYLASEHSSLLSSENVKSVALRKAKKSIESAPGREFTFDGSTYSYARMGVYFAWLENRSGIAEVFRVYDEIKKQPAPFIELLCKRYALSRDRLDEEVLKYIESQGI